MLSLSKLLLLALVIAAAWFGWRWIKRVEAVGRDKRAKTGVNPGAGPDPKPSTTAQDLTKCPECGAYVLPGPAGRCGRPGCPY